MFELFVLLGLTSPQHYFSHMETEGREWQIHGTQALSEWIPWFFNVLNVRH